MDNTKLTPELLAELRRLDAEATPGPWFRFDNGFDGDICTGLGRDIGPYDPSLEEDRYPERDEIFGGSSCEGQIEFDDPNAVLTCAMRNALPALLDEIDQLKSELAAMETERAALRSAMDRVRAHEVNSDRYVFCAGCDMPFLFATAEDWGYDGNEGAWLDNDEVWCPECWAIRQAAYAVTHWICCDSWVLKGEKCPECGAEQATETEEAKQ